MATISTDRRRKIIEIARTRYGRKSDPAQAYLQLIGTAPKEEHEALFAFVIQCQDALPQDRSPPVVDRPMTDDMWKSACSRVSVSVAGLCSQIMRKNAPVSETAAFLWNQLSRFTGNDQVVALALLLNDRAIPYAQRPDSLLALNPDHHDRLSAALETEAYINAAGTLRRLRVDVSSALELAAATAAIIGKQPGPVQELLIGELILHGQRSSGVSPLVLDLVLSSALTDMLHTPSPSADEPVTTPGRKSEK